MSIGKSPSGESRRDDDKTTNGSPERPPTSEQSIGRALASARVSAGLTVEQVSSETRVRVPIVHAIEADDFSRCGGDFYARGHIRAIAKAVGADGAALVAQYDSEHGGSPAAAKPVPMVFESERVGPDRRRPNWTAAMVAAIVVVVAVIGFNLISGKSRPTAEANPTSASPTAAASPSPTTPPSTAAPTPTTSAIAAVPADKVIVKVTADHGTSWMAVTGSGGKSLFRGDLADGQSQTFTDDKQIKLVIGNAAAVHLFVNGKDLGPAGTDGQVVRLTYTPGNPQAG